MSGVIALWACVRLQPDHARYVHFSREQTQNFGLSYFQAVDADVVLFADVVSVGIPSRNEIASNILSLWCFRLVIAFKFRALTALRLRGWNQEFELQTCVLFCLRGCVGCVRAWTPISFEVLISLSILWSTSCKSHVKRVRVPRPETTTRCYKVGSFARSWIRRNFLLIAKASFDIADFWYPREMTKAQREGKEVCNLNNSQKESRSSAYLVSSEVRHATHCSFARWRVIIADSINGSYDCFRPIFLDDLFICWKWRWVIECQLCTFGMKQFMRIDYMSRSLNRTWCLSVFLEIISVEMTNDYNNVRLSIRSVNHFWGGESSHCCCPSKVFSHFSQNLRVLKFWAMLANILVCNHVCVWIWPRNYPIRRSKAQKQNLNNGFKHQQSTGKFQSAYLSVLNWC